eukprot:914658-Pyramimonas_sp.AAC.1
MALLSASTKRAVSTTGFAMISPSDLPARICATTLAFLEPGVPQQAGPLQAGRAPPCAPAA